MKPELIVPLDVNSLAKALKLRDELADVVDFFKVGKELFTTLAPRLLDDRKIGRRDPQLPTEAVGDQLAGIDPAAHRADAHVIPVRDVR